MKTFSRILSEVAQPNSEDELNFKQKHIIDPIDHTVAPESTFSGAVDKDDIDGMKRYRKNKRLADYQRPDDEDVYEAVTLKRDLPGQEDSDVDNDADSDMTDAQYKYRKHAQIKMHKIDEAWSDGINSRNAHLHAKGAANYRKKANDAASMAKRHSQGSPEHNKHMAAYHSATAKSIKSSYHAGQYGSMNSAKRDHKAEMDQAAQYRSGVNEDYKLYETVYVIPEEILATEKNAFHTAAANAHATGKKHFAFGGKKYPVTMSKDAAKTFAGKGNMSEALATSHKTYADYIAHNKAKGLQVIPRDLWNNLKKNPNQPSKMESMDPVGKEDDDINNDDKVNKSDKYLHARRKAISASIRTKIKEGFGAVAAAGGDYDEEPSHQRYKKSNTTKKEDAALGDGKGSKIYAGKTRESQIDEVQIKKPTKSEREIAYTDGSSNSSANMKVNRLAYALDKEPKKKVSLPKTPWNEELEESMSLDKVNKVHAESGTEGFAKDYVKGNKGDYTSGGPTEKHEKDSEKFHTTYKRVGGKSGFGGSGHDIYQHNTTGAKFRVDRNPNGKGFHGTDHMVSKINEEAELDEVSDKKLDAYRQKAFADQPAGDDGSDKYRKRKFGRDLAFDKQTGRAKVLATKEEVELDEVSKKTLGSYIKKASHDVATNSAATARYSERANKALDKMKTGDYSGDSQRRKDTAVADKAFNKSWKRRQGIAMAADKLTKEDINEAFSAGSVKLNDGSSILVKAQDAKLLNDLMNGLKSENKAKMMKVAMTDKSGFNEILGFAREAL
jgi:hypothetical protein